MIGRWANERGQVISVAMNKEELLHEIGDIFSRLDKVASDLSSEDMVKAVAWQDDETAGNQPVDDYPSAVLGLLPVVGS